MHIPSNVRTSQETVVAVAPQTIPNQAPPVMESAPQNKTKTEAVTSSVESLEKQLKMMNETQVHLDYDKDIDRVVVKYVSPNNGEVVRQIPSQDFVEWEKEFVKTIGLLFDKRV